MLVLSRYRNESIMIGDNIQITVLDVWCAGDRNNTKIGVEAPEGVCGDRILRKDECFSLTDEIVITVVDIRSDRVRLGIEAPKDVPVHRNEVYDAIHQKKDSKDDAASD